MTAGREADGEVPSGVASAPPGGPTTLRILLGARLRRLREQSGISRHEAGYSIRSSHSKISRLELGRSPYKERDVKDLLTLYGVTDEGQREELLRLARQASAPGWWQRYGDIVPVWSPTYLGMEQAASLIRVYAPQYVPDLLQTEEYARGLIRLEHPGEPEDVIDRRVALKLERQRALLRGGVRLWALMDETALMRPVGDRRSMRAQIDHLLELGAQDDTAIQVLPFGRGHPAASHPFTVLRFAEPDLPDVVYIEYATNALYLDKPEDVERYVELMGRLMIEAPGIDAMADLLRERLTEI
ncbi:helix-turn-helix domain-containing protein [Actinomadura sp. HBU206391]|uniref:helix-turn-helix domain-containing protein n=1 Tax=Actinomadura sp. HBU206391 TaxID=2731692 RepID=UPI00164FF95A|nr:helix-turn-helix transcriptional regulator [Actinomadura sp. HBU206391]MBC6463453.1 helix-turn-helix domain-containing protein [Actinomadura sp. HBU206391]